ncbi:hypothetical protein A2U01_0064443, partial [Trifolium medium]|nr:hypothetical protein [Trifolium medium]
MPGELFPQIFPRSDGLSGQVLVPSQGSLPQCGREKLALNGSFDPTIVQQDIDILDVLVGVCQSFIGTELGWLLEPCREWYPHDV